MAKFFRKPWLVVMISICTMFVGVAPIASADPPEDCRLSTPSKEISSDVPMTLGGVDESVVFEVPTLIRAPSVVVSGAVTTTNGNATHPNGVNLCIITNTLIIDSSGSLCTGDGFSPTAIIYSVGTPSENVVPDGGRGGEIEIRVKETGPAQASLQINPGGTLCSGDGGAGSTSFVLDRAMRNWTLTCSPVWGEAPDNATGASGGDAGQISIRTAAGATISLGVKTIRVGKGGNGGSAIVMGNPTGNYHATGGKGGQSFATLNDETMPATALSGSQGGDGGDAYAFPCPTEAYQQSSAAAPVLLAGSSAIGTTGECGPLNLVSIGLTQACDQLLNQQLPPGCGLPGNACVPPNCLHNPIVFCLVDTALAMCYNPGLGQPCAIVDGITGQPVVGGSGTSVNSEPDMGGGTGNGGYSGSDGSRAIQGSIGVSGGFNGGGVNADISLTCVETAATNGKDGSPGGPATDGAATGGNGERGLVRGGRGGNAHLTGAPGGFGGPGGKGGNGASDFFCGFLPPANGGYGGIGGNGAGGLALGGMGGPGPFGGAGGDATGTGSRGGNGGLGGDGGDSNFDPTDTPPPGGHPAPGLFGCGGVQGAGGSVDIEGGLGGTSDAGAVFNGPKGEPMQRQSPPGRPGDRGAPGKGAANENCAADVNLLVQALLNILL